ncbi:MAG: orotidine-5'-phosphate decarboxylase [Anaerolineae bacterium]|nr:orotidine-5'-phosphate decarboxylase [Anaerolineae bacterium]
MTFIQKLQAAQESRASWLCVGIDPVPDLMPPGVDLLAFGQRIVEATAEFACAFKPNLAFFLAYGIEGMQALHGIIDAVPSEIPVILDAKFGDIAYTAGYYARAAFDILGADAVTVSPYVGMDAVTPLLDYADRMVFVHVRSTNTTGNDFQLWPTEQSPLYRFVTAQVNTLAGKHPGQLGLMVGATQPHDLAQLRSWAPNLPFLIPGIGVQQGDLSIAARYGSTRTGIGPVISIGRSIVYASQQDNYVAAAHAAAQEWAVRICSRTGSDR